MAKVSVLEPHQDISDKPHRHVKKCVADVLVRKLLAKRISRQIIQMLVITEAIAILAAKPKVIEVPKIKPPRAPENLLLTYPHRDQRTLYL